MKEETYVERNRESWIGRREIGGCCYRLTRQAYRDLMIDNQNDLLMSRRR